MTEEEKKDQKPIEEKQKCCQDFVYFDDDCRLVIKDTDLCKEFDAKFREHNKLVIRFEKFEGQHRNPDDLEKPEEYQGTISYEVKLDSKLVPWPGVDPLAGTGCPEPGGGDNCRIPPRPVDMGCGCDILVNLGCN